MSPGSKDQRGQGADIISIRGNPERVCTYQGVWYNTAHSIIQSLLRDSKKERYQNEQDRISRCNSKEGSKEGQEPSDRRSVRG